MGNKALAVAFTGGGTGGHIYPGLAVADALRQKVRASGREIKIVWIGSRAKMDRQIVQNARGEDGSPSADAFFGIPSGKLRRYFSLRNFLDAFKIAAGFFSAFFILLKERPALLFSKGGFVSVPPCAAARLLGIKVFTHECDFTPGLATRINAAFADKVFVTYEETRDFFSDKKKKKCAVTGNPSRPVFYSAGARAGLAFLGMEKKEKPLLLVTGGSLGAAQINELVWKNLSWLCERFLVVHQTGQKNESRLPADLTEEEKENYRPYAFIYAEMPGVMAAADVVLSRAGANSIWECAVLGKPMVLIPLEGSGTRGDQVDNAEWFLKKGAALVLRKDALTDESFKEALLSMEQKESRERFAAACRALCPAVRPAEKIAALLAEEML